MLVEGTVKRVGGALKPANSPHCLVGHDREVKRLGRQPNKNRGKGGTLPRIPPKNTMERQEMNTRDAGIAGPPAAGPVVHTNWEDNSTLTSNTCDNDGGVPKSSERHPPDNPRVKVIGRFIKIGTWNVQTLYIQ